MTAGCMMADVDIVYGAVPHIRMTARVTGTRVEHMYRMYSSWLETGVLPRAEVQKVVAGIWRNDVEKAVAAVKKNTPVYTGALKASIGYKYMPLYLHGDDQTFRGGTFFVIGPYRKVPAGNPEIRREPQQYFADVINGWQPKSAGAKLPRIAFLRIVNWALAKHVFAAGHKTKTLEQKRKAAEATAWAIQSSGTRPSDLMNTGITDAENILQHTEYIVADAIEEMAQLRIDTGTVSGRPWKRSGMW